MGTDDPVADVERQPDPAINQEPVDERKEAAPVKEPKDTAFRRFMSGPYFDVIPAQYERVAHQANRAAKPEDAKDPKDAQDDGKNYIERLRTLVTTKQDQDGKYGLNPDELVPLPFDAPKWHAYLVEILTGVYMVAQATIVMFIAIYVENQERAWKDGRGYTKSWLPLVKALIIVYPLITLIILVSLTIEYAIRKFMYFRLLSMRILVDWKNVQPHQTIFFYYFLATWAMMFAWAVYGLVKYYNKDGNEGVDPVSFGTFVVVNLQTVQLLLYYLKLLSTEARLVSLNQIFERAPVEAQHLLEFTYVIEEEHLVDECYKFALHSQRTLLKRMLNIVTCCMAAQDWNVSERQIGFDIERLRRHAPNFHQVQQNVQDLLENMHADSATQTQGGSGPGRAPDQIHVQVDNLTANDTREPPPDGAGHLEEAAPPRELLSLCGMRPLLWVYRNAYGSLHSLHTSVLISYNTWPFRRDVPYFRMLTLIQLLGIFAVGVIVVLGWLYSTNGSNCTKAAKTCNTCLAVHDRYFSSEEPACSAMETAIANIVASANGTWYNNGVLEERYCNWACYGNFTPSQSCPALN